MHKADKFTANCSLVSLVVLVILFFYSLACTSVVRPEPTCPPSSVTTSATLATCEVALRGRILFTLIDAELWKKLDQGTRTPVPRDLWVIRVDGTDLRRWVNDSRYKDQPRVSPDGAQVAYMAYTLEEGGQRQRPSLWVASVDGSQPRQVDPMRQESTQPGQWGELIGWSPNGEWLAYITYPGEGANFIDDRSLRAVHISTGRTVVVLDTATATAAWAPTAGAVLVFDKTVGPDVIYEVNVEHLQEARQVERRDAHWGPENWLPDGKLFWIDDKGGLTLAAADGTFLRTITMPKFSRLWWSPNGHWCAYTAYSRVKFRKEEHNLEELCVIDDEGQNRRSLITRQQFDLRFMPVAWSPDSAWLAGFGVPLEHVNDLGYSDYTGRLYIVNIHSGRLITLTEDLTPQPADNSMVWIR